jgi:hypothetical protein
VTSDPTRANRDDNRVVPFRPRDPHRQDHDRTPPLAHDVPGRPMSPRHLSQYERGRVEDDYRHRMVLNVLGAAVIVVLMLTGVWLANSLADMRRHQDCFLSGRRNCAPIEAPPIDPR